MTNGQTPDREAVLQRLLRAHEAWFDVCETYEYAGRTFAGYAELHSHGERYVLTRRAKLWEVDAHEYAFFHCVNELDEVQLDGLIRFMMDQAIQKVVPEPNHMSSALTLVVVADRATCEAKRRVRTTRFRKNFAFGIRGWADLRLALLCVEDASITTNAAGKPLRAMLAANAGLPEVRST